jgi:hypothetical protein
VLARHAAGDGIELLAREDLLVGPLAQVPVRVRRVVRDHEDGIAGFEPERNIHALSVRGVDPPDERERAVGPLVLLDPAVIDRLEEREVPGGVDRPRLQVDVRAVVMRPDRPGAGQDRLGTDDHEDERPVARVDEETRSRLHLPRLGELGEPGGPGEPQDLRRRAGGGARHVEVGLVAFGEFRDRVAVRGRQAQPRGLLLVPDAPRLLVLLLRRNPARRRERDGEDEDRRNETRDGPPHDAPPGVETVSRPAVSQAVMPPTTFVSRRKPSRSRTLVAIEER